VIAREAIIRTTDRTTDRTTAGTGGRTGQMHADERT
jgi:hypothetical protein